MAYSVDWINKLVTVPTSDLTLVSGTHYKLLMSNFLVEIRRLEAAFDGGLWAPQILEHTNPKLDFAGASYAGFDEIINGYTLVFTGVATRVDLIGSNTNIIDVLVVNGVSVVPNNSSGLQIVAVGSGVTADDKTDIINGVLSAAQLAPIHSNVKLINDAEVIGDGSISDKWRSINA